jgi:hypothetical protein
MHDVEMAAKGREVEEEAQMSAPRENMVPVVKKSMMFLK